MKKKLSCNIKNDPKSFYAYVRSKSKSRSKVGPLLDGGNLLVDEDEQMCNILNNYFSSVFTSERLEGLAVLEDKIKIKNVSRDLNDVLITEEVVYKKLCSLKTNKAHGQDGMASLVLKELANEIKGILTIIFNKSMAEHKVPSDCKIANVTPIFF